ncbi:MAG TPA: nitrate reductase molybdenum cofactor assembly chaperone [Bacillota bacterium]|nr:nitrate reductase molybdenum cofactor assembly chaperone [Bacillota bacterium]
MNKQQKIFKLASVFLHYPEREWLTHIETIKNELNVLNLPIIDECFQSFLTYLTANSHEELCERYVKTFDFYHVTTLNLTYNVFKDSRERGNALIKLRQLFSESKFQPITDELPDYVPLILEFLSVCEEKIADRLITLHYKSFVKLEQDLIEHKSPYRHLMKAVVHTTEKRLKNIKAS